MVPHAPALPTPRDTVHLEDVVAIERWAAAQQAQLRLLQRELLTAQADAHAALVALEVSCSTSDAAPGTDLERQLAAVRDALARRLQAEVEAARAESQSMLSEAVREATDLLLAVGVDPAAIRRITTAAGPSAGSAPLAPRTATPPVIAAPRATEADDWSPPEWSGPLEGTAVVDLTDSWLPGEADGQAFDRFWGDVFDDRPVRDRFRRWVQRQEQ
ncbi:MAG TPA: hypothetical protein VFV32_03155 [Acidimicrobiales bacterium]|nr:hypothetical protein [Acidimicrobiales bacterium]